MHLTKTRTTRLKLKVFLHWFPIKDLSLLYVEGLLAGVRSGCAYCGARSIQELHEKAQFVQITASGVRESNPHDVIVTE